MTLWVASVRSDADPDLALRAAVVGNLPLVGRWLAASHVSRWWGAPDAGLARISASMSERHVAPYLIVDAGRSIGYVQFYHANPDDYWQGHNLPKETFGLDLFIGEAEALGRGRGTRAIRLAVAHLLIQPGIARIHVDPSPDNVAAIRTYAKAGFVRLNDIETPDGPAGYMVVEPKRTG